MSLKTRSILLLLFISIIWGFAFAAQSLGADQLGPFTFFSFRNYFAVFTMAVMLPFRKDDDLSDNAYSLKLGAVCGFVECAGALLQQYSIGFTTAANCSFITALYVVLVPFVAFILGKKTDKKIIICVLLEIVGMYLLCFDENMSINKGDLIALGAALMFAFHIIIIDRGGRKIDTILFCFMQFIICALVSTVLMFIFEMPINFVGIKNSIYPLLYTGVLSSAVAITIQVSVQKKVDPTIASLIMCLESVFGAVGGWIILNEILSFKEICGCLIMFVAIVLSQINFKK